MNTSMFLFVALVLCALPSALGEAWCYRCTPNITTLTLCTKMEELTRENCTLKNSTCFRTSVMGSNMKSYVLGCNEKMNCTETNTSICTNSQNEAKKMNLTVSTCKTECFPGNGSNGLPMMSPAPSLHMTMVTTSMTPPQPVVTTKPTSVAEKLRPSFLGVLFFIILAILRQ